MTCDECGGLGCEVCEPPEPARYAEDDWKLFGAGLDWADTANQRGWCWRDTDAFLRVMYAETEAVGARLSDLLFRPSPVLARLSLDTPALRP